MRYLEHYNGINKGDWYVYKDNHFKALYKVERIIIDEDGIYVTCREYYIDYIKNKHFTGVRTCIKYDDFKYYTKERKAKLEEIEENLKKNE